jgi:hypothetical protein
MSKRKCPPATHESWASGLPGPGRGSGLGGKGLVGNASRGQHTRHVAQPHTARQTWQDVGEVPTGARRRAGSGLGSDTRT